MYELRRYNPARIFEYYVVNGKRVGRSYYIKSILCGKGGRLCSNIRSPAAQFNLGRDKPYCRPSKATKEFLLDFAEFFKNEFSFKQGI